MAVVLELRHRIVDGDDAWLEHFLQDAPVGSWDVRRSARDPDELVVSQRFGSRSEAEAALANSELSEALRSAGVDENSVRVEFREAQPGGQSLG